MIVEATIVPLGVGVSLSEYVAEVTRIIESSGLNNELHSMGTNIEGDWDEVMTVIRQCHDRLAEMGVPRISTQLKISIRTDKEYTMAGKVRAVRDKVDG